MSTKIDEDTLYDVPGVAKILGISERTVRKMMTEGTIKGKKLGRKWYATGAIIKAHFAEEKNTNVPPVVEKKTRKSKK
ncbi:Helix-turn-helix domain protein [Candidatus Rubidus massiliensis]|nr:Helix-turn-helix domain protein [Candidatus Rubidus massiliensis]